MSILIDLTGKRFGRWLVLERTGNGKQCHTMWLCRCDCGREGKVSTSNLRGGRSVGCQKCASGRRMGKLTHGQTGTRLHNIWLAMKRRCNSKTYVSYRNYGARGIKVCKEWMESFDAFRGWALANGYADNLSIDRIDNDGNYCPENCRWATRKQQACNTRRTVLITINGVTRCRKEWAETSGIGHSTIDQRQRRNIEGESLLRKPWHIRHRADVLITQK